MTQQRHSLLEILAAQIDRCIPFRWQRAGD